MTQKARSESGRGEVCMIRRTRRDIARQALALCLSALLAFSLTACGHADAPPPTAEQVLSAMQTAMEAAGGAPDGRMYSRQASPDSRDYLGDTLLSALYGEAARGLLTVGVDGTAPAVGDAAIFLSTAPHPAELAVFRCSDARGVTTAAKLCRARLDLIRRAWDDTAYAALVARGTVTVEGSYVLLIVAEDPDTALYAARGVIG